MSSTTDNTQPTVSALAAMPTLILPSAVSVEPIIPLAPIPTAAAAELSKIVNHATAITAPEDSEATVAKLLLRIPAPAPSFIDDEDDNDADFDDFEGLLKSSPAKGKGKAKAAAPAATTPPVPSSSAPGHEVLKRVGFVLSQKPATRYGPTEHKAAAKNIDALAMGLVDMDARVSKFSKDLEDGLSGVHARVVGLAADMAEGGRTTEDPYAMSTVVSALNTHTANGNALADAIRAVQGRIAELEKMPAAITSIQASLDAVHNTLRVVLSRTSASTGSAPPAPTAAEAVVINANGKRVHDADGVDDAAKRQHLAITAPTPFSLPTAPPPPGYAAPAFAAPAPLLPAPFVPAAAAPMPALIAPAPVPAHPFAVATIAPTALPTVPAPLPRAPPAGAPRVPPNPAREVLFGPMNWEKKWNRNPHNLIMNTLGPNTMRGVHFSSRRGADDDTVIVVFEAETVANWFVTTWNASSRLGYEICTARPQSLNV